MRHQRASTPHADDARDAGLSPSRSLMTFGTVQPTGRDAAIVDIGRWCIERNYQTP
jgi:hypothetical protein